MVDLEGTQCKVLRQSPWKKLSPNDLTYACSFEGRRIMGPDCSKMDGGFGLAVISFESCRVGSLFS
jgi:hypothetical protein